MRYLEAADGVRIAYETEGSGRPLLLLHGLMAHRGFFEKQRPLADGHLLIRPDLRGHGDSTAPPESVSVEAAAADVEALADELGLREAVIVGWSLGASVLWHLLSGAASHRFAGAVVVDMTPCVMNRPGWALGLDAEACEARSAAIGQDFETFARAAGQAIFKQPIAGEAAASAAWASDQFARNDPRAIDAMWRSLVSKDFRGKLGSIDQPTLIVHGAHSHLYGPGTAAHLAAALPRARAVRFDESGHSPHLDQPERFNTILRQFAAGLAPARTRQMTA